MAIHLLRDYITQNITTVNRQYVAGYILTLFMRRVLLYSYVADTNYPINAVGTLLIATGDTTPTAPTPTFPAGNKAGINLGSQREFYVTIPSAIRVVQSADIGRVLVLRSVAYPTFNSGVFVIVGIDLVTNSYIIDYRTLGDKPPVEAADSIAWYLYDKDINCPISGTTNTKTSVEYRGDENSTTPRIVLQSQHATAWQVRICNETTNDYNTGTANCAQTTVAPGYGATGAADFPQAGSHFHAAMWYNSNSVVYQGGAPGFGDNSGSTGIQYRITIVGDDTGQGVVMYVRRPGNAITPKSNIVCFGLAENEPSPLPVNNASRLFCVGSAYSAGDNNNDGFLLIQGVGNFTSGMTLSTFNVPTMVAPAFWTYVTAPGQQGSPIFDGSAGDNPYTSSTELLPLDLMSGTLASWNANTFQAWPFSPRNMGTMPHIREGRTNFGDFSPTTDANRSYQHLRRGLYIPWNGPNLIP